MTLLGCGATDSLLTACGFGHVRVCYPGEGPGGKTICDCELADSFIANVKEYYPSGTSYSSDCDGNTDTAVQNAIKWPRSTT